MDHPFLILAIIGDGCGFPVSFDSGGGGQLEDKGWLGLPASLGQGKRVFQG